MQVRSLGREDLLEEGMAIHSGILAWKIPQGCKELDMTEVTQQQQNESKRDRERETEIHYSDSDMVAGSAPPNNVIVLLSPSSVLTSLTDLQLFLCDSKAT